MEDTDFNSSKFYRINEVEYTNDGHCAIGVYGSSRSDLKKFKLSGYCYKLSWLTRFKEADLSTIWQLTKRQYNTFSLKRIITFALVQYCVFKYTLSHWEEDFKNYMVGVGDDCDEW